jgi:hypothetical protein
MADLDYGYEPIQIQNLERTYLRNTKKTTSGRWRRFIERNPDIARRRAKDFDRYRAASFDTANIDQFFQILKLASTKCKEMSNNNRLTADPVFAAAEVGFDLTKIRGYKIGRRGMKNPFL